MERKTVAFLLMFSLIFGLAAASYCENKNLSRKEVEKVIEDVATKRGIPSIILKSVAKIESSFVQFNGDGKPKVSRSGHIGIMQVSRNSGYDVDRLKKDPVYNIEVGADLLLAKWKLANNKMPKIGNMDPNILEHWYFALWAYNGILERNNPNVNKSTYQDKIYNIALKEYGQKITPISRGTLPSRGIPKNTLKLETPEKFHEGDIIKYTIGDKVKLDGKNFLIFYDKPHGKDIGKVKEEIMTIVEGPVLSNGFYFYKVKVDKDESKLGWVYGNWIIKVDEK
ncbi:transglycosylase SLT domain-containing protein [Tissierella sp. MSJ-40]|uniref:Transglycosylase SLT domain-containing protein n=1 Tax=Tissierella simiarum TaxID=2841534 RepID=A0ABS6E1D0_9FIRM|nr:transglycosylase SLT domain-containing protein [Tissierella simiarum]MBU5436712.1 transglycosylase SLT domain-containing protein [Tissierella simiarum]